jgi:outer membrane protein
MKKVIFLILLLCHSLLLSEENKITLGAGAYVQSQPYKGASDLVLPSPVIFFDNGIVYARWSRFGLYFLGEKAQDYAWGFSLTVQPRTLGYKASDSSYLSGMDERKSTLEGGVAFSASFQKEKYIEVMLLADMMGTYNSWLARAEIGDKYELGKFTFYPSLILLYEPNKFVNYYYGVKKSEATLSRPYYSPNGGLQYGLQTYIKYPLTQKLSTLINLRYDRIPSSASDSPLTDKSYIYSGLFSLIYTFEY